MSDSNRRFGIETLGPRLLAITVAFAIGVLFGLSPHPEKQREAAHYTAADSSKSPAPTFEASGIAALPAPNLTEGSADQAYYNSEDLQAQRIMAWWTRIMGFAAAVGIFLGGVSIWLIWKTWSATREAARAGFEANHISRQAMENQNRAWIKLHITGLSDLKYIENEGCFQLTVNGEAENIGETIAVKTYIAVRLFPDYFDEFSGKKGLENFVLETRKSPRIILSQDIFPKDKRPFSHTISLKISEFKDLMQEHNLFPMQIAVIAIYNTVYDEGRTSHETLVTFRLEEKDRDGSPLTPVRRQTVRAQKLGLSLSPINRGHVT